jgi:hypothetical protein
MNFSRLFVVGALVVVVGMLTLPFVLSNQYSAKDDYKEDMASWHVSWSDSVDDSERASLLPELEKIRPPVGSVELLDRHRIYMQAHIILSQANELVALALRGLATMNSSTDSAQDLTCDNIDLVLEDSPTGENELIATALAEEICALHVAASKQLSILRIRAQTGWLRDAIREHRTSIVSGD